MLQIEQTSQQDFAIDLSSKKNKTDSEMYDGLGKSPKISRQQHSKTRADNCEKIDLFVGILAYDRQNSQRELSVRIGDVFKKASIPREQHESQNDYVFVQKLKSSDTSEDDGLKVGFVPRDSLVKVPLWEQTLAKQRHNSPVAKPVKVKSTCTKKAKTATQMDSSLGHNYTSPDSTANLQKATATEKPQTAPAMNSKTDILLDFLPTLTGEDCMLPSLPTSIAQPTHIPDPCRRNCSPTRDIGHINIPITQQSYMGSNLHPQFMQCNVTPPQPPLTFAPAMNLTSVPLLMNWVKNLPHFQAMAAAAVMNRYNLLQLGNVPSNFGQQNLGVKLPPDAGNTHTMNHLGLRGQPGEIEVETWEANSIAKDTGSNFCRNANLNGILSGLDESHTNEFVDVPTTGAFNHHKQRRVVAGEEPIEESDRACPLKRHGRGRPPYRSVELIVGMGVFEHGRFKKLTVRNKFGIGGKEAINVRCTAVAKEIESAAIQQHKQANKLINNLDFTLVYPDGTPVKYLPGTCEPFVLKRYKEMRNDSWIRLRLFLCPTKQLFSCSPIQPPSIHSETVAQSEQTVKIEQGQTFFSPQTEQFVNETADNLDEMQPINFKLDH